MARPKRGEILSLTIDDLAFGGEGVGRADGYVVFVPGALPGDRLQVRLAQARSPFAPGALQGVFGPPPPPGDPPCPHFRRGGGGRLPPRARPAHLRVKAYTVTHSLE